jgi:hypothetical protein
VGAQSAIPHASATDGFPKGPRKAPVKPRSSGDDEEVDSATARSGLKVRSWLSPSLVAWVPIRAQDRSTGCGATFIVAGT